MNLPEFALKHKPVVIAIVGILVFNGINVFLTAPRSEDPEYIMEPLTHSRELLHRPDADMSPFNCDMESTRRFVPGN